MLGNKDLSLGAEEGKSWEKESQFQKDFALTQKIVAILKNLGFETVDYLLTESEFRKKWELKFPVILVRDGADSIRMSIPKGGELKVWFTNELEDPRHPRRQQVVSEMVEAGLGGYVNKLGYKESK